MKQDGDRRHAVRRTSRILAGEPERADTTPSVLQERPHRSLREPANDRRRNAHIAWHADPFPSSSDTWNRSSRSVKRNSRGDEIRLGRMKIIIEPSAAVAVGVLWERRWT